MSRKTKNRVGVIGLGQIGSKIASGLRGGGFSVYVWNRTPRAEPNFLGSAVEVADLCDVIQLFVPDEAALHEVVRTVAAALRPQHVILGHATVTPEAARQIGAIVESAGARYLDAPFVGTRADAEARKLVYYIGGRDDALKDVRTVLQTTARRILSAGGIGDASLLKLATQTLSAITVQGLAEMLAFARAGGLRDEMLLDAMDDDPARSALSMEKLEAMSKGQFNGGPPVRHSYHALALALKMAGSQGVEMPAASTSAALLFGAMKRGQSLNDAAIICRALEPPPPVATAPAPAQASEPVMVEAPAPAIEFPAAVVTADPEPAPIAAVVIPPDLPTPLPRPVPLPVIPVVEQESPIPAVEEPAPALSAVAVELPTTVAEEPARALPRPIPILAPLIPVVRQIEPEPVVEEEPELALGAELVPLTERAHEAVWEEMPGLAAIEGPPPLPSDASEIVQDAIAPDPAPTWEVVTEPMPDVLPVPAAESKPVPDVLPVPAAKPEPGPDWSRPLWPEPALNGNPVAPEPPSPAPLPRSEPVPVAPALPRTGRAPLIPPLPFRPKSPTAPVLLPATARVVVPSPAPVIVAKTDATGRVRLASASERPAPTPRILLTPRIQHVPTPRPPPSLPPSPPPIAAPRPVTGPIPVRPLTAPQPLAAAISPLPAPAPPIGPPPPASPMFARRPTPRTSPAPLLPVAPGDRPITVILPVPRPLPPSAKSVPLAIPAPPVEIPREPVAAIGEEPLAVEPAPAESALPESEPESEPEPESVAPVAREIFTEVMPPSGPSGSSPSRHASVVVPGEIRPIQRVIVTRAPGSGAADRSSPRKKGWLKKFFG